MSGSANADEEVPDPDVHHVAVVDWPWRLGRDMAAVDEDSLRRPQVSDADRAIVMVKFDMAARDRVPPTLNPDFATLADAKYGTLRDKLDALVVELQLAPKKSSVDVESECCHRSSAAKHVGGTPIAEGGSFGEWANGAPFQNLDGIRDRVLEFKFADEKSPGRTEAFIEAP